MAWSTRVRIEVGIRSVLSFRWRGYLPIEVADVPVFCNPQQLGAVQPDLPPSTAAGAVQTVSLRQGRTSRNVAKGCTKDEERGLAHPAALTLGPRLTGGS